MEKLAQLRPLFPGGTMTAGNASGINDGAAAIIVASERSLSCVMACARARGFWEWPLPVCRRA